MTQQFNPILFDGNTANIPQTLKTIAREKKLTLKDIDFTISATKFIATSISTKQILDESYTLNDFIHNLNSSEVNIEQIHSIEVFLKKSEPLFNLKLKSNKDLSEARVVLLKGSSFAGINDRRLYAVINKHLALNNAILYVFEKNLKEKIKNFLEIYKDKILDQDVEFSVAQTIVYEPSTNDSIEHLYLTSSEKADLYDKNFAKKIIAGTTLIQYNKSQTGISGHNILGKFSTPKEPDNNNFPDFFIDNDSIIALDSGLKIEYKASKTGYLDFSQRTLRIADELNVENVSAKTTGSIHANDLNLQINEKNKIVDAVGPSMVIKATSATVNGSVSENARISVATAIINGVTHSSSTIFAIDEAKIQNHRGSLYTRYAEIEKLEAGLIDCDTVFIEEAFGGVIRCNKAIIKKMHSNCKVIASCEIKIFEIVGEENTLCCSANANVQNSKTILTLKDELNNIAIAINNISKEIQALSKNIKSAKTGLEKIGSTKLHTQASVVHSRIKQNYKQQIVKLNELKEKLSILEKGKQTKADKLKALGERIYDAHITICSLNSTCQTVTFIDENLKTKQFSLCKFNKLPILIKLEKQKRP